MKHSPNETLRIFKPVPRTSASRVHFIRMPSLRSFEFLLPVLHSCDNFGLYVVSHTHRPCSTKSRIPRGSALLIVVNPGPYVPPASFAAER